MASARVRHRPHSPATPRTDLRGLHGHPASQRHGGVADIQPRDRKALGRHAVDHHCVLGRGRAEHRTVNRCGSLRVTLVAIRLTQLLGAPFSAASRKLNIILSVSKAPTGFGVCCRLATRPHNKKGSRSENRRNTSRICRDRLEKIRILKEFCTQGWIFDDQLI